MNYLIKLLIFIFVFTFHASFADDNKIIFEVNDNIFTSVDLNNRIKYLDELNLINSETVEYNALIEDFYKIIIFYEYVKKNNYLNNSIAKESKKIFDQILSNNKDIKKRLSKEIIKKNINYDYSRKIVLESILDSYKEYIFNNAEDINFIYNYKIKYITVPIKDIKINNEYNDILSSKNINKLYEYLNIKKIKFYLKEQQIKDINKLNDKIKSLINSSNRFIVEKDKNYYKFVAVKKELNVSEGVYYRLFNIRTNQLLKNEQANCNYIQNLENISLSKEYEFNSLNKNIKNNLIFINDFLIIEENNSFNYIFLCEIRVDEKFLREININKKINFLAKDIETNFVNKYSKIYNAKIYE